MGYTSRILVLANRTLGSDALDEALARRAQRGPVAFTLLVPAAAPGPDARAAAAERLAGAIEALQSAGLRADGSVGDCDPLAALVDAWDPSRWDEVIVSTLPGPLSTWLQIDLPHRIARMTGVHVTHVIAQPPRRTPAGVPPLPHSRPGVLAPLAVMGWTGQHH